MAEHFHDPSVQRSIQVNLALVDYYDKLLTDLELFITKTAKKHDVNAYYRLRSVPGIGKILALVILYEIHDIHRFARVQDFASYCRLVKSAKESAGKRYGSSGSKIGNAHLKWAFSEAAVLFLKQNAEGKKYHEKLKLFSCSAPHPSPELTGKEKSFLLARPLDRDGTRARIRF